MNLFARMSVVALVAAMGGQATAQGTDQDELEELRQLVADLRNDYERRISDLEGRLEAAEQAAATARRDADEAIDVAEQVAINQGPATSAANTFNPSIGAVLQGHFANVDRGWEEIPGFQPAGEIGTGESGFALGEAEVNMNASVDNLFFANLTLGLHEEEGTLEPELEEAWLQTTSLPAGFTVSGGRFFSRIGYLNGFHFHADDFVDRPLPYQAFVGGRYGVDGVRASWVAPTAFLLEAGAEADWGGAFPATMNQETSPGSVNIFAKLGGDVGMSHSWQVGLAHSMTDAVDREGGHEHEEETPIEEEAEAFTGDSDLTVFDFVWKWAPEGNNALRNFKLQGEYFRRSETGTFAGLAYDGDQSGWYLQGVWQFMPRWRVGLRFDEVDADNGATLAGTEFESPSRSSRRGSLMFDWSPSEFSRLRLQYTDDRVLAEGEDLWYLQYIMSIGAHGAHQF